MKFKFQGQTVELDAPKTLGELRAQLAQHFDLQDSSIRLLGGGKRVDPGVPEESLISETLGSVPVVMVLATKNTAIQQLQSTDSEHDRQIKRRAAANATLERRSRVPRSTETPIEYTFAKVQALQYGPVAKAQAYLERIRDDKAVQALMAKHKLKVGLLTELDPASNTRHDGRTLGLNENAGQTIYLRIRTDAYDGFCNYNEILMVLCHELAHNTHSDHSRAFWETCKLYERQIKELNPWKGGHSLV